MTPDDIAGHLEALKKRLAEVESELAAPDIYSRQGEFKRLSCERGSLAKVTTVYDAWKKTLSELEESRAMAESDEDESLRELAKAETERLEGEAALCEKEVTLALIPPGSSDSRDAIVEIRPAAGGDEAALFAAEAFRMYQHYAERKGWKCEVLGISETPLGGIKEAVFSLSGENVFSFMRFESGVHRVQRVPDTENSGRIHTSTVTVSVLPEAGELDDIVIRPEDLDISTFRSSGPGGQNVNRTDSAVRMVHKPTGITVASQQERSQLRNREVALRILKAKLLEIRSREEAEKHADAKRSQVGTGDRSEKIRTYNFPQDRVTDHHYDNITCHDLPSVMEGDLDKILDLIREEESRRAVASLLAKK